MVTKIWTKVELGKGNIPSDKIHFRGKPFEDVSLSYVGIDHNSFKKEWDKVKYTQERNVLIAKTKLKVQKEAEKIFDKYNVEQKYRIVYLNFNADGLDIFFHR